MARPCTLDTGYVFQRDTEQQREPSLGKVLASQRARERDDRTGHELGTALS